MSQGSVLASILGVASTNLPPVVDAAATTRFLLQKRSSNTYDSVFYANDCYKRSLSAVPEVRLFLPTYFLMLLISSTYNF